MNWHTKRWKVAILLGLLVGTFAQAADLRTTGGRTIRRSTGNQVDPPPQANSVIVPEVIADTDMILAPGSGCDSCGQTGCASCIGAGQFWASFEFLLWWRKERYFPPLVTTSPNGTPQATAGVLGQPTTSILFGGDKTGSNARPGGRVTLGMWLNGCRETAVVGRFYSVGRSTVQLTSDETQFPIIARPFFNITTNQQDAELVAFPSELTGAIDVTSESEVFGGDVLLRRSFCDYACGSLDLLVGYQFSRINEDVQIRDTSTSIAAGGSIPLGTVVNRIDVFDTSNEFNGAALGFVTSFDRGCWSWELLGKLGLGNVRQTVTINGASDTTVPGLPTVGTASGLLAQPSNIGVYRNDRFLAVPELNLNAAWHITPCVDVTVGYSLIYWGYVVQPGDQIDLLVNATQVPGPIVGAARPAFTLQETDYWVHGLNLGFTARF